jgi:hypothetical protein
MKITIDFDRELTVTIFEEDGLYIIRLKGAADSHDDLVFPDMTLPEFVTGKWAVRLTPEQAKVIGSVLYAFVNPDQIGEWMRKQ